MGYVERNYNEISFGIRFFLALAFGEIVRMYGEQQSITPMRWRQRNAHPRGKIFWPEFGKASFWTKPILPLGLRCICLHHTGAICSIILSLKYICKTFVCDETLQNSLAIFRKYITVVRTKIIYNTCFLNLHMYAHYRIHFTLINGWFKRPYRLINTLRPSSRSYKGKHSTRWVITPYPWKYSNNKLQVKSKMIYYLILRFLWIPMSWSSP